MCRAKSESPCERNNATFKLNLFLVFYMKCFTIVGARPQFVKASVVSTALRAIAEIEELIIHTGQHYSSGMSDIFFREMGIPKPQYNLGVGSNRHGRQTGEMLTAIEEALVAEKGDKDILLVYGDTNSTLAGALAAAKLHIPVVHVEAGLRSFNRTMPEEINRVLTDHASEVLIAPTQLAVDNLLHEGIGSEKIHLVGDVMYDAALQYASKAAQHSAILNTLQLREKEFILATIHRAENTDTPERLTTIFNALSEIHREVPVVLPLHPRTRKALQRQNLLDSVMGSLYVIDPVGYLDMVMLEKNACLIMTDSGGVQKEAFFYQVPCVTLRDETEWEELVDLGWNTLISPNEMSSLIAQSSCGLIGSMGDVGHNPYGTGNAAQNIAKILQKMTL